jgi:ATP-dependent DNA helicase PIF1
MAAFEPLSISPAFNTILDQLEHSSDNLFITGQAGTGKSTLLKLFTKTTKKKVVITAPTGVAALQAGGQTIHSFFGFPPHLFGPGEVKKGRFKKLYQKLDVLVIDEISMVRADLLDRMDLFLRINRERNEPFGGVQVVFFGDLFQLPPVVRREEAEILVSWGYESPYFFSAQVLAYPFHWKMVELQEVFRQKDHFFLRLLDQIRTNQADEDTLDALNMRVQPIRELKDYQLILAARNFKVDQINQQKLQALTGRESTYQAEVTGRFTENVFPTDQLLKLREGAQVMFIRNDPDGAFVNGTIGLVESVQEKGATIAILKEDGTTRSLTLEPVSWEIIRYGPPTGKEGDLTREVLGTFKQLPLKLAWAVTIHKSQGQTFDQVVLDMSGGMFEHGQMYVALSRCRTLEGITLSQPIRPQDIRVDERIVDFYQITR